MPSHSELLSQAQQHANAKRFAAADALFAQAHQLDSQHIPGLQAWGNFLKDQRRFTEAERCYRQVLQLQPQHLEALKNLGIALANQNQLADAIKCYQTALQLKPDYYEALNNLGNALRDQGEYDAASQAYQRALAINPQHADIRANFANMLLLLGQWEQGWQEYECRWQQATFQTSRPQFIQSMWNGEPLSGRAILLYAEQGLGDTLQFIRYAFLLKQMGAYVVFMCPKPLGNLFQGHPAIDDLVFKGDILPAFDYYIPLLSLPRVLRTRPDSIPANIPYLGANEQLVAQWGERLRNVPGLRIGINWHGRLGVGRFQQRDIPLSMFATLAALPNVSLISLQKGERNLSAQTTTWSNPLIEFGDELDQTHGAFMDTAAIMNNLHLVITSDTSVAHLAGGLGVTTWLALNFSPDWRWQLQREDSPWYPTMHIFRQTQRGDWTDVFDRMKQTLLQIMSKIKQ